MKFNWGTGIVIAFIAFMSFILYFVIMMSKDRNDHHLVTEDYYQQELQFQNDIDKLNNAKSLESNLRWQKTDSGMLISFPENLQAQKITGNIELYRPSNKHLDYKAPIKLTNHSLLIPNDHLLEGRWDIRVDWSYEDNAYLYKQQIVY
ncbi:FixH family protein [Mangrovimonas sp. YM274]|uniref:FixH family protein n=1 Tax=Mangrovimonas sp. YM274 TaxID=3070660 RepID=UPI0027DD3CE4|nr:FixH family protein [Mangrovimonas sp. YM274]WMI69893.1 FixH family protein [Mangrovimonas sp. YM274]